MANIALATFGTRAAADSFMGWYRTWPVHDGKRNEQSEEGRWGKVRWLSAGTAEDHWFQLLFPGPQLIRRAEIYWAQEKGGFLKPVQYRFEAWLAGRWVPLGDSATETDDSSVLEFTPVETERVRVFMPAGAGAPTNPTVLGIAEIEVYADEPRRGAPCPVVVLQPRFESRANPPLFNWTPVPGALGYRIDYTQGSAVVSTNHFMPAGPLAPGVLPWRVAAVFGEGQGPWSEPAELLLTGEIAFAGALPPVAAWRSGHPRLPAAAFDRERLQGEAVSVKAPLWTKIRDVLAQVEEQPPAEPPGFDDNFWTIERWREIVGAGARVLDVLSLSSFAYALSGGEPSYRDLAKRWLLHAARWAPEGTTGIESVDHAAHDTLVGLSFAYDALWHELTEEERSVVRQAIAGRCRALCRYLNPFENDPNNNHPWFQTTALGIGALAIWDEEPDAAEWASFAVQLYVGRFLCLGGADGEWHEGSDYWTYGLGFVFDFCDAVRTVTGLDLYQHPWLRRTARFKLYVAPPGGPGLSFGDTHKQPPNGDDAAQMFCLAARHRDTHAQWYAARALAASDPQRPGLLLRLFLWWDPTVPERPPTDLPGAALFAEAGWAMLHSTLEHQNGIHFAMHSGHFYGVGGGHSHADQNSFMLFAGGEPLVIDSGCYDWYGSPHFTNWFCKTPAHNTILVDGEGQAMQVAGAHGKITAFRATAFGHYMRGDASNPVVYQGRVRRFDRHVLWLSRLEAFVIIDEVETTAPARLDWLLHVLAEPSVERQGDFVRARVARPGAALELWLTAGPLELTWAVTEGFPEGLEPTKPVPHEFHMAFRTAEPAAETRFVAVLAPVLPGAARPAVRWAGEQLHVSNGTDSVVITHRPGAEPAVAEVGS